MERDLDSVSNAKKKRKKKSHIHQKWFSHTRCRHLGEEEQEERGGVDLQVTPLVVPDNDGTSLGVVLGMQ